MRRQRATGRKPAKARQATKAKRDVASKPARNRRFSASSKDTEVARLARERDNALEQLSATSEMLKIISSSPGELEPVFNIMLANATRLCDAKFGNLYLYERGALRVVASHNVPPAYVEARRRRGPFASIPDGYIAEAIKTKQSSHVADLAATRPYAERNPIRVEAVELGVSGPSLNVGNAASSRTIFSVSRPMLTSAKITFIANIASLRQRFIA